MLTPNNLHRYFTTCSIHRPDPDGITRYRLALLPASLNVGRDENETAPLISVLISRTIFINAMLIYVGSLPFEKPILRGSYGIMHLINYSFGNFLADISAIWEIIFTSRLHKSGGFFFLGL